MKHTIILIIIISIIFSCSQKVYKSTLEYTNKEISFDSLSNLKYHNFFDSTFTFNYNYLIRYRKIETQIPAGIQRRKYYGTLALLESYVGNYYKSVEITDKARLEPTDMVTFDSIGNMTKSIFYPTSAYSQYPDSLFKSDYDKIDFNKFITNLDNSTQVFALNEAHTVSLFRSTLYKSLPQLWKNGYRYLVLETFYQEKQQNLNSMEYPFRNSGYFCGETIMGDIIRRAKELGFTLISYDAQNAGNKIDREIQSYKNIKERIFKNDPKAKIILYAGHSHISELPIGKIKLIGVQFNEDGINPITIDQFSYYERNVPNNISNSYLLSQKDTSQSKKERYDYILIMPKSKTTNGRANWIWELDRKPININLNKINNFNTPFLIEAFIKGESIDGIPLDRIEITDKNNFPSLALRKGKYIIRLTLISNKIIEFNLNVK